MTGLKDPALEVVTKFLADKSILIVDPGNSSRIEIMLILSQMGAKSSNCTHLMSLPEAQDAMKASMPSIVIADFSLGMQSGLDLFQSQRSTNPEAKKAVFILLTSNAFQLSSARVAEGDVDAFVLKPLTLEAVKKTIIKSAITKPRSPLYLQEIEKGKVQLEAGDFDGALVTFSASKSLDSQPSLACFYLAQIHYLKNALEKSRGSHTTGLDYSKIHYRCLVGLYELLMSQKSFEQAYEVVKKLWQFFPASPKRMAEVLRLAIINKSYDDVEKYYESFLNMDEQNDTVVKYVCAALVVCGKYHLMSNNRPRALDVFQKAAVTSAGRVNVLVEILKNLVEFGLGSEAQKFFARIPAEELDSPAVRNIDFLLTSLLAAPTPAILKGSQLISEGLAWDRTYESIVKLHLETGSVPAAEDAAGEGISKFPDLREPLEALLARHKSSAQSNA